MTLLSTHTASCLGVNMPNELLYSSKLRDVCFRFVIILIFLGVAARGYFVVRQANQAEKAVGQKSDEDWETRPANNRSNEVHFIGNSQPVPAPLNPDVQVQEGFRGDVHPLLHGQTLLEVTAYWTPVVLSAAKNVAVRSVLNLPATDSTALVQSFLKSPNLFLNSANVRKRKFYTAREFSVFLPQDVPPAGQIWAIDEVKVAAFLKQFHPNPSTRFVGLGRRVGPDGAFAILRAVSSNYLDILFRLHVEFVVSSSVRYAPAYFSGRVLVNREAGTVEYFQMQVPTDKTFNVIVAVARSGATVHDMARVDRMELSGGTGELVGQVDWVDAIDSSEAHHKLKSVFYKFLDIDWIPADKVLTIARERNKPILAMTMWGALDDQSC